MSWLGVGLGLRIWLEKQTALLWEKEGPDAEGREKSMVLFAQLEQKESQDFQNLW